MNDRPLQEGYGSSDRVARDERYHVARFSSTATLTDLAREYAIFTHGLLFTHGRIDVDPVLDYVTKHPEPDWDVMPVTYRSRRLFRGLSAPGKQVGPPITWESSLLFVERARWQGLYDHLRCCAWIDRRRRTYGRVVPQHITIIDFLALDRAHILPAPLPTVEITVFGVDSNKVHAQFLPDIALPGSAPTVVYLPVLPGTIALADALLSEAPHPFRFVEGDPIAVLSSEAEITRERHRNPGNP
jgi:hypothetical protein